MSNWFDEDRQTIRYIGVHQRSTMATFDIVAIELVDPATMVGLAHKSGEAIRRCAVIVFDVPTYISHLGGYIHDLNRPNKGGVGSKKTHL